MCFRLSRKFFAFFICLCLCEPSFAVIAFKQSKSADLGSQSSGGGTITFTSNVTAGSLLVVAVRLGATGRTITLGDDKSNTYSTAYFSTDDGQGDSLAVLYAMNAAAGATTVTISFSGAATTVRVAVHEYSGIATSNAFDQPAKQNFAATTTPTSGNTSTTAQGDELLFGYCENGAGFTAAFTAGSGYAKREELTSGGLLKIGTEDQIVSVTGTYAADVTLDAAGSGNMGIATFKGPAASASNLIIPGVIIRRGTLTSGTLR